MIKIIAFFTEDKKYGQTKLNVNQLTELITPEPTAVKTIVYIFRHDLVLQNWTYTGWILDIM